MFEALSETGRNYYPGQLPKGILSGPAKVGLLARTVTGSIASALVNQLTSANQSHHPSLMPIKTYSEIVTHPNIPHSETNTNNNYKISHIIINIYIDK